MTRIVIIGGGPAGYEAALVAAQLGADVTVVDRDGVGGACVLDRLRARRRPSSPPATCCTAARRGAATLGVTVADRQAVGVDLADGQRAGQAASRWRSPPTSRPRLEREGVAVIAARRRSPAAGPGRTRRVATVGRRPRQLAADVVLIATGATPRVLPGAEPDGERILDWRQVYDLPELPEHLIVVGSGVTGAEFAVRLPRDGRPRSRSSPAATGCCPARTPTPPTVIEDVFAERGMTILAQAARPPSVRRDGDGVVVTLADGRTVEGSHA